MYPFALQCSDPTTPKGNWVLPLGCVSRLYRLLLFSHSLIYHPAFPFSLIFSSPFDLLSYGTFSHTPTSLWSCSVLIFPHPSFNLLFWPLRSLWLSWHACLFYSSCAHISKPPASPRFSIPPHVLCSRFCSRHCSSVIISSPFFPLLCLHPPSV